MLHSAVIFLKKNLKIYNFKKGTFIPSEFDTFQKLFLKCPAYSIKISFYPFLDPRKSAWSQRGFFRVILKKEYCHS